MSRVEFIRDDFRIAIAPSSGGGIELRFAGLDAPQPISPAIVERWLSTTPESADIAESIGSLPQLQEWANTLPQVKRPEGRWQLLRRVVLDTSGPLTSALPWEQALAPLLPAYNRIIVRSTPVLPRHGAKPFTLPMRILQIGPENDRPIAGIIRDVFGSHPAEIVRQTVVAGACKIEEIAGWRARSGWPTAEVLHFDAFPWDQEVLETGAPDVIGTLGWLERLTSTWQTRFVVLHCADGSHAIRARVFAGALAARGGPAVLVADLGDLTPGWYYRELYEKLIHDSPLDDTAFPAPFQKGSGRARPTLLGGGGREESLRFSALGVGLAELARQLWSGHSTLIEDLLRRTGRGKTEPSSLTNVTRELDQFARDWDRLSFDLHESEGVIPMAERVEAVRRAAGVSGAVLPKDISPTTDPGRYVNAVLGRAMPEGGLDLIPQDGEGLRVGETYHLVVDIGPKDVTVRTVGTVPLLEEQFEWTEDTLGIWLEIGVTGIDFEVLGDAVQQVWLPREGPSASATFAVLPRVEGVAHLRFCVYFDSNVIQSFRIAAFTRGLRPSSVPKVKRAALLAKALELAPALVDETAWLTRMEYALAPGVHDADRKGPRGLSLVANTLDGRYIVTMKGGGTFNVRQDIDDASKLVERVRETLREVSTNLIKVSSGEEPDYLFGQGDSRNRGDEKRLKPALMKLADVGWKLFNRVVPGNEADRKKALEALYPGGDTIHVAHIHLDKVIPWAAMYTRLYDARQQTASVDSVQHPVAHDACLAALPSADGKLPGTVCGQLDSCVLNPSRVAERLAAEGKVVVPETVACPLLFLGFRHILELPPQQVEAEGAQVTTRGTPTKPAEPIHTEIVVNGSARVVPGFHAKLNLASAHETKLGTVLAGGRVRVVALPTAYDRDRVLEALQDRDLDLVYFFCHARGGRGTDLGEPVLEFQPKDGEAGSFESGDVRTVTWGHHPLVILNGCNTVGFSPSTLSPFIQTFVHDCGAAGLIGTEAPVFEQLSSEFAERFLTRFLAGEKAGHALLQTRREFLAEYNPLGLVYTLYASADLHIRLRSP